MFVITRRPITVDFAREVLQTMLKPNQPVVTFDSIAGAVCEHFSLRPGDLRSKRRTRSVVVPRQLAMYLCRRLMRASFPHIGELFGRAMKLLAAIGLPVCLAGFFLGIFGSFAQIGSIFSTEPLTPDPRKVSGDWLR